jgi:hypothetical protein
VVELHCRHQGHDGGGLVVHRVEEHLGAPAAGVADPDPADVGEQHPVDGLG